MLKKVLGNGIAIELDYSGGGATAPDIIWVKKVTKDGQKTIVGQIKDFTDSDKVDIKEIDSNYIALKFLVTDFQDHPVVFTINLNNKIERSVKENGNQTDNFAQVVDSNLPPSFTLKLPIFKGTPAETLEVETFAKINGREVHYILLSPGANAALEEIRDEAIDNELEDIIEIAPEIAIIEV